MYIIFRQQSSSLCYNVNSPHSIFQLNPLFWLLEIRYKPIGNNLLQHFSLLIIMSTPCRIFNAIDIPPFPLPPPPSPPQITATKINNHQMIMTIMAIFSFFHLPLYVREPYTYKQSIHSLLCLHICVILCYFVSYINMLFIKIIKLYTAHNLLFQFSVRIFSHTNSNRHFSLSAITQ